MGRPFLAHVRQTESGVWLEHDLADHLWAVAQRAEVAASRFTSGDWAHIAGLWHDLGKFKTAFQDYIRSASSYHADAHLEDEGGKANGKVDHSTAGALLAIERNPALGRILAYLIAGHHSGLPDWRKDRAEGRGLCERIQPSEQRHLEEARQAPIPSDILHAGLPSSRPPSDPEQLHLWIRMLFSALVDADFLDTEDFMDPEKAARRGPTGTLEELQTLFEHHRAQRDADLHATGRFDSPINGVRREILEDCRNAAVLAPGFFSLTVPTGGGKTLSSLAFALEHAARHGHRRILLAIPFTSIIEQTAQVLTGIFGAEKVLEHHSNVDLDRETPQGRLAAENWDSPLVVTTNVQLFESLFASRTSRCRKLHNIAGSVIILDEAHLLPSELFAPTLSVLKGLVQHFGCTVVLCTATQPALVGNLGSDAVRFRGLEPDMVREIIRDPDQLANRLRRVSLRMRSSERVGWPELAKEIAVHPQALCIVNRRKDCRDLWEALSREQNDAPIHLSALMCGEHRSRVIQDIRDRLKTGLPLRVVSTQLVEAGVDLDFPIVFRAMAGLDSLAQAAGRCNREGRMPGLGEVFVFHPPQPSPAGLLRKGEDAGAEVLRQWPELAAGLSPEAFRIYFRCFYNKVNDFGRDAFKAYGFANISMR